MKIPLVCPELVFSVLDHCCSTVQEISVCVNASLNCTALLVPCLTSFISPLACKVISLFVKFVCVTVSVEFLINSAIGFKLCVCEWLLPVNLFVWPSRWSIIPVVEEQLQLTLVDLTDGAEVCNACSDDKRFDAAVASKFH